MRARIINVRRNHTYDIRYEHFIYYVNLVSSFHFIFVFFVPFLFLPPTAAAIASSHSLRHLVTLFHSPHFIFVSFFLSHSLSPSLLHIFSLFSFHSFPHFLTPTLPLPLSLSLIRYDAGDELRLVDEKLIRLPPRKGDYAAR